MNTTAQLIKILSDGEFHSGEDLGQSMSMSRAAVWKHIEKVRQLGVTVVSQKGSGYQIPGGFDPLSQQSIVDNLSMVARQRLLGIDVTDVVTSTNQHILGVVAPNDMVLNHGVVTLAEKQTAGKGRRGRQWISPYGANIYMSLMWQFGHGMRPLDGLSLAVAVALAASFDRLGIHGVQLKWPNDLLYQQKKVGGILVDVVGDPMGLCSVVVGVGLNVSMSEGVDSVGQPWSNLPAVNGRPVGRNALAAAALDGLVELLSHYEERGFSYYREQWLSLDAFSGKPVTVSCHGNSVQGIASGVDNQGALRLEVEGTIRCFNSGEVSLRASGVC